MNESKKETNKREIERKDWQPQNCDFICEWMNDGVCMYLF